MSAPRKTKSPPTPRTEGPPPILPDKRIWIGIAAAVAGLLFLSLVVFSIGVVLFWKSREAAPERPLAREKNAQQPNPPLQGNVIPINPNVEPIRPDKDAMVSEDPYLQLLLRDKTYGNLNRLIAREVGKGLPARELGVKIGGLNLLAKEGKLTENAVIDRFQEALRQLKSAGWRPDLAPVQALDTTRSSIAFGNAWDKQR